MELKSISTLLEMIISNSETVRKEIGIQQQIVLDQKIFIPPHGRSMKVLNGVYWGEGGGGKRRARASKFVKETMKLDWNFQRWG